MSKPFFVSEKQLLVAAQADVRAAGPAFLAGVGPWLDRTATRFCRKHHVPQQDIEDVTQEWVRRLLDPKVRRFTGDRPARIYMIGVLLNVIDVGGRQRAEDRLGPPLDQLDEEDVREDPVAELLVLRHDALARALAGAQLIERAAAREVFLEGRTTRAAAAALSVSAPTISRALARLRGRALAQT